QLAPHRQVRRVIGAVGHVPPVLLLTERAGENLIPRISYEIGHSSLRVPGASTPGPTGAGGRIDGPLRSIERIICPMQQVKSVDDLRRSWIRVESVSEGRRDVDLPCVEKPPRGAQHGSEPMRSRSFESGDV